MALRLSIENETNLPDGGPVTFTVAGRRTIDIGRDQHLDWTLPDPSRFISSKHCEVSFKDGGYWLRDVSSNGTYLNGAEERMRGPHRLKSGDRFIVGQYIIVAALDADAADFDGDANRASAGPTVSLQEMWADNDAVAPPIDPRHLRAPAEIARPTGAEFLDWAASVPNVDHRSSLYANAFEPASPAAVAKDVWDAAPSKSEAVPSAASAALSEEGSLPFLPAAPPPVVARDFIAPIRTDDDAPKNSGHVSPFLATANQEPEARAVETPHEASSRAQEPLRRFESSADDDAFLGLLATAAGLPSNFFADADRQDVARQIGAALRATVEGAMQLLKARNQAKQLTRSASHTTIEATGNNPLKFSPTADDAMRIMFGSKSRSYLDATETISQTFDDLKSHQLKTYAAVQFAVSRLVASLEPAAIAKDLDQNGGASFLSSKKGRLWDDYRARWDASMLPESGGPIAAFMLHFSDFYDDADRFRTKT